MTPDIAPLTDHDHGAASAEYDLQNANTHESHNLPDMWAEQTDEYKRGYNERWEQALDATTLADPEASGCVTD